MAAGVSGATCAVRLRQLQALRERQAAKEARLEAEVIAEASELQELQQSNARNAEAAERELVELTATLQRSLRCEDELITRVQDEEVAAAQACERKAKVSAERDATVIALRAAEEEFRQWDAALWEEKAEKERYLQELHEQRQAVSEHEQRAAQAVAVRTALELEVAGLRRQAMRVEHRELAGRRILAGQNQRRLREGFHGLGVGTQAFRVERKRWNLFQKRWFSVHGFDAFATWRWHGGVRARWREAQRKAARSLVLIFLHAWAFYVSDLRWMVRQLPAAVMFWQRWLTCRTLSQWSYNVRQLIRSQCGLAVRRLGVLILRSWQEESAAAWWARRVEGYFCLWRKRSLLRRSCQEWGNITRAMRRVHRQAKRFECRSQQRRARKALQSWAVHQDLHARAAESCTRQKNKLLHAQWLMWRQNAARHRAFVEMQSRRNRRFLRQGFTSFSRFVERMRSINKLAETSHCCGDWQSLKVSVFQCWWKAAAPRRGTRWLARRLLLTRLQSWKRWAVRMHEAGVREKIADEVRTKLAARTRRRNLSSWAVYAHTARKCNIRASTIRKRQSCTLCREFWHVWLSYWKACIRERCAKLEEKVREAYAGQESMKHELTAMRSQRGHDELVRLSIVDELQRVCGEVAELSVDLEAVRAVTESLEEAAASEREVASHRREESNAIRAQRASIEAHRFEECTLLEARFREAMVAPAMLRSELHDCEEQTAAAEVAEAEAKCVSTMLQRELENLHATVPACIRERSNQVAELRDRVIEARCVAKAMEEELAQQQSALQIRDAALEERRREDTDKEITLFRTTLP